MTKNDTNTFRFECVGCFVKARKDRLVGYVASNGAGEENSYLTLKKEPSNPYDPNAIAVLVKGEYYGTVGYVGKDYIQEVKSIIKKHKHYKLDMANRSDYELDRIPMVITWEEGE